MKKLYGLIIFVVILATIIGYNIKTCNCLIPTYEYKMQKQVNTNNNIQVEYEAYTLDCQNGVCLLKREVHIE